MIAATVALSSFSTRGNRSVRPRIMIESNESSRKIKMNAAIQIVRTLIEDTVWFLLEMLSIQNRIITHHKSTGIIIKAKIILNTLYSQ